MDAPENNSPPPKWLLADIFFALVVFTAAAAVTVAALSLYYHHKHSSTTNLNGFNVSPTQPSPMSETPIAAAPQTTQPSQESISMIRSEFYRQSASALSPQQKAAAELTAACRAHEAEVRDLAIAYTKKYPVIREYGRDWMSYPDLRKLDYDYAQNHDPIAFLNGVLASKNFRLLIQKYVSKVEIQDFARDIAIRAPADAISAVSNYLGNNQYLAPLTNLLLISLGLPPGMVTFNGQSAQVNPSVLVQSLQNNSPSQGQAPQNGAPTLSPP